MQKLQKWLPIIVIVGILLDFGISWAIINNTSRANCWDDVLDKAVTTNIPQHILKQEARGCAKL